MLYLLVSEAEVMQLGSFYDFIEDKSVRLIGCEAAGLGVDTDKTAATMATGTVGIFHGMKSYFCQDEYGQIAPVLFDFSWLRLSRCGSRAFSFT